MSPALQRTNLPPPFIITLQGITTPTKKMAKDAHDPLGNKNDAQSTYCLDVSFSPVSLIVQSKTICCLYSSIVS